ncbi:hypothetical protein MUP95_09450, partial [bacterium]|nr:hypothetical protein [bacterium]
TNFKRKLIGFGILLAFFMFSVFCLSVYKVAAQTQEDTVMNQTVKSTNAEAPVKETNPDVVKFAFLAAAIAVSLGSIGAGAAV